MKKGFTLIELLGVILILSLIMLIAIPRLINFRNDKISNTDELTEKMIYDAAKLYVSDNSEKFVEKDNKSYCITLNELTDNKYLKSPIKLNNTDITNEKSIKVTYNNGYEYNLTNLNSCDALPIDYVALEYIESTGTQYIDTEFYPNQDTRLKIVLQTTYVSAAAADNPIFFGTRTVASTNDYWFGDGSKYNRLVFQFGNKTKYINTSTHLINKLYNIDLNKNTITFNDTTWTLDMNTFQSDYTLYLLAFNAIGTPITMTYAKLYSCSIYDNGTLVRNYIPSYNTKTEKAGLYDLVEHKFYTSAGEDDFVVGPEV